VITRVHLILAVLALCTVLYLSHRLAVVRADLATEHALRLKEQRDTASALAAAQATARKAEHDQAVRFAQLDAQHQQELADAQRSSDRVIADLQSGALRLRQRLAAAAAAGAGHTGAAAASSGADEGTGLRPEDAGFLVRLADSADADIRALQAVVLDDRQLCGAAAQQKD
jgi:hypothetical protein